MANIESFGFVEGKPANVKVLKQAILDRIDEACGQGEDPVEAVWDLGLWIRRETRYNLFDLLDEGGAEAIVERLFPDNPEKGYAFLEGAFAGP